MEDPQKTGTKEVLLYIGLGLVIGFVLMCAAAYVVNIIHQ